MTAQYSHRKGGREPKLPLRGATEQLHQIARFWQHFMTTPSTAELFCDKCQRKTEAQRSR